MNQPIFEEKNINPDGHLPENPKNSSNRYAWSEFAAVPEAVAEYPEAPTPDAEIAAVPASEKISLQSIVSDTVVQENEVVENKNSAPAYEPVITRLDPAGASLGSAVPLLAREDSDHFRSLWNDIQGKFVDDPRAAVQQADGLVTNVIEEITQMFANEHATLEGEWKQGNDVSTEDLRKALQRYRSFFNRLVV